VAVVLDSGAVVAFLDRDDVLHASADAAIRGLIVDHRFYASAVTFGEVLTGARLGRHAEEVIRGFFEELVTEILPIDIAVAERAARLRGDYKSLLRIPEAFVLATADLHPEVEVVLTTKADFKSVRGLSCEVSLLR
jgi:predicted nucleic acid-binding protein